MKQNQEIEEETKEEIPTENKATYERIPETELEFSSMIARRDKQTSKFITQLRFITPENEVFTWKPMIVETINKKGSIPEEVTKSPKSTEELPQIIKDMYKEMVKNKSVAIKVSYTKMTTLKANGEEVSYNFFTNGDIESIEIVE